MSAASEGFVKLQRSDTTIELLADMPAMHLLTVIAARARFSDAPNLHGLAFGQALVGDCAAIGMTQKEYRCAKHRLERYGLAAFDGSPRGTIATLSSSKVFSIRDERNSEKQGELKGELFSEVETEERANSGASEGRAWGERGATNKEGKKGKKDNTGVPAAPGVSRFVPPTPEEVTAYSTEIGYPMNGAAWCDSYAQKGWMVGKSPMKDWRAAVRNWKSNKWQQGKDSATAPSAPQRDYLPLTQ